MSTDPQMLDWRSVCPISSGLDILGDKWSLLIVRDLHSHGSLTYSEFLEAPEHIATNILAARLRFLTFVGIIERTDPRAAARNNAYRLTTERQGVTAGGRRTREVVGGLPQDFAHRHGGNLRSSECHANSPSSVSKKNNDANLTSVTC